MPPWPRLKNAPINEAIIDLKVQLPPESKLERLAQAGEAIKYEYPTREERRRFEAQVMVKGPEHGAMTRDLGADGYIYRSADNLQVAQFGLDGFTFSRLKPYTEWKVFVQEAKKLWSVYSDAASPSLVKRIAVRYINVMQFNCKINALGRYLRFLPKPIPTLEEASFRSFLNRIEWRIEESDATCLTTYALEPPRADNPMSILLDIDVFRVVSLESSQADVWTSVDDFREIKNRVFFNSITTQSLKLFNA